MSFVCQAGWLSFSLHVRDDQTWRARLTGMRETSVEVEEWLEYGYATGALFRDPDRKGVALVVEQTEL